MKKSIIIFVTILIVGIIFLFAGSILKDLNLCKHTAQTLMVLGGIISVIDIFIFIAFLYAEDL